MGVVDQAFADALRFAAPKRPQPPEPPATVDEAAAYFGGTWEPEDSPYRGRSATRALADRYGVTIRTAQRWLGHAGETRQPRVATRRRILALARRRQLAAWRKTLPPFDATGRVRSRGLRMRMRATVSIYGKPFKTITMPANASNVQQWQYIEPDRLDGVLDAWAAGDRATTGDELTNVFLASYGIDTFGDIDTEVRSIDWAQVQVP